MDVFTADAYYPDTATWQHFSIDSTQSRTINLESYKPVIRDVNELPEKQRRFAKGTNVEEQVALAALVFGTFMALTVKPQLNSPMSLVKVVPAKLDRPRREYWSPNIVGKFYTPPKHAPQGTHASPRMHWRRGHFRHQPFGPGRQERKVIWLEPMLVSAGDDEAEKEKTE